MRAESVNLIPNLEGVAVSFLKPNTMTQEFEIEINKTLYFGTYHFEGNRLFIDTCVTYNEDEESEVVSDETVSRIVYPALESDKSDEIAEYRDALDWETRYSRAEDLADEKRKYL